MPSTTNTAAASTWTLVKNATGNVTVSINFVGVPVELATTTTSTAPAETIRGHRVTAEGTQVRLVNGERLWQRSAQNTKIGDVPQVVITEGS